MKRAVLGLTLAVLVAAPAGRAGPVAGGLHQGGLTLGARSKATLENGRLPFKGNERACVIFLCNEAPAANLAVTVYDEKDNVVAQDDAGGPMCAAIWYPPHDAPYRIVLENKSDTQRTCYVAVK
jgi:hypothetical protein